MKKIITKISELKIWQKVVLSILLVITFLFLNFRIINYICEKKEKQIITSNFNNFKKQVSKNTFKTGEYKTLIINNDIEYLNTSKIYKNKVVSGDYTINNNTNKNFSIINIYEKGKDISVKGYKLADDKYISSTDGKINDLSFFYYNQIPNAIIKSMKANDLKKNKDESYSITLKNSNVEKSILKDFGIDFVNSKIEYLIGFNNSVIDRQAFKITYTTKDGKTSTLEYTSKIDEVGKVAEDDTANISIGQGNIEDLIKQFTRTLN